MSYPYHMQQWDQWQHRSAMHRLERERREAVAAYVRQHQSNTPEGASGCRQAVVSHEARAVAARGSLAQKVAGNSSALAAVSTTAAAPENPRYRVANPACGARCRPWVFQAAEVVLKLNNDFKPQAEALPDPLIPSPIDLRQFAYFPVDLTHPSFGELVLIKSDAVFRAVVSLISWSITRVPAGCFPADMVPRLSRVAAPSERWWKRRQAEVLSHFVLCSDGNYYHRELSKHIIDLAEKMKPRSIRNLGDATPAEWVKLRLRVFERDEFKCQYCGQQAFDCDHVIAVADGGPTVESNLVAACFRCNRSKGKKPLSAWLLL